MEKRARPTDRSLWTFSDILDWHLFENGTRPGGTPEKPGKLWPKKKFAEIVEVDERSVRNWLNGSNLPNDLAKIENALFGDSQAFSDWRRELRRAFAASKKGDATPQAAAGWAGCPYPGLRPFEPSEALIFAGREDEVVELVRRLRNPSLGFLAVVGGSGAGKSSVVHAGLLPRLATDRIEGNERWIVLSFTPTFVTNNPFAELAGKLVPAFPKTPARKPADLADALFAEPRRISDCVDELLTGRPSGTELIMFVDQFEELFSSAAAQYRDGFIELLAEAADNGRVRVLTTLRVEFLPQCLESDLRDLLQQSDAIFPLGRPGKEALRDMILEPARRAGLDIEVNLAKEILNDAGDNPGEVLPLVAFCLEELYRRTAPVHRLTVDAYLGMGRLRGSIARRVAELLKDIKSDEPSSLDSSHPQTPSY